MRTPEVLADAADLKRNRMLAVTAYIWLLFLLVFALGKDSRLARYHARQGAVLYGFSLLATVFIRLSPPGMQGAADLVTLLWIALIIVGVRNAWKGRLRPLPVIGRLWNPAD